MGEKFSGETRFVLLSEIYATAGLVGERIGGAGAVGYRFVVPVDGGRDLAFGVSLKGIAAAALMLPVGHPNKAVFMAAVKGFKARMDHGDYTIELDRSLG